MPQNSIQPFDSEAYLSEVVPRLFSNAFSSVDTIWSQSGGLVMDVTSQTKQNIYTFLAQAAGLEKWEGERQIRQFDGHEFTVRNEKYTVTHGIDMDDLSDSSRIVDFNLLMEKEGQAAAEHKDQLIWEFLVSEGETAECYDGTPLLGAAHPLRDGTTFSNLISGGGGPRDWYLLDTSSVDKGLLFQTRTPYEMRTLNAMEDGNVHGFMEEEHLMGVRARVAVAPANPFRIFKSDDPLDADNFFKARSQMRSYKGDRGRPVRVRPNVLMVAPEDEKAALEIVQAGRNAAGATNVLVGMAQVVVNEYLS